MISLYISYPFCITILIINMCNTYTKICLILIYFLNILLYCVLTLYLIKNVIKISLSDKKVRGTVEYTPLECILDYLSTAF